MVHSLLSWGFSSFAGSVLPGLPGMQVDVYHMLRVPVSPASLSCTSLYPLSQCPVLSSVSVAAALRPLPSRRCLLWAQPHTTQGAFSFFMGDFCYCAIYFDPTSFFYAYFV